MTISLIMPVFNAAHCLPDSLRTLREQTFRDFEVVFVDDCSTDGTPELLEGFRRESGIPCQILRQEKNGGVAAARNRGLDAAGGDYLAFLDADDRMEPVTLEKAAQAAVQTGSDIVGWDWTLGFDKNGRYMRQADYDTPLQALRNLTGGTMRWNLWLFLVRRDLLERNGIRFIDGANMGEDMMVMLRAFASAGKVVQLHESLYRYNAVSSTSLSRQFSEARRREITENLAAAEKALAASQYAGALDRHILYLKLFLKRPLLVSADRKDYETWYGWFPEANAAATENKALPLRTRLLQGWAARRIWWAVKMYYLCVYKIVYGIIYR
ncbi:MAG: glycosyltransferase family 2 protein [Bacteroidales bacterium]|nr:glycosyltransferase family 2 protein [Bacteroidales bacterium]